MLLRCVTFQSDHFRTPGAESAADLAGEDVAAWLRGGLPSALEPGAPIREDYGWGIWVKAGADPYWIAIGLMDEDEGEAPRTWLVTAAYDPGFNLWRRLVHRPRREDLDRVCRAIDEALQGGPGIGEVRWWDEQPFMGRPRPHPDGGDAA